MRRKLAGLRRPSKSKEKSDPLASADSSSSSSSSATSTPSTSAALLFGSNASLSRRLGFRRSFSNSSRTAATVMMVDEEENEPFGGGRRAPGAAVVSPTDTRTSDDSSWSWNESSSETVAEDEEAETVDNVEDRGEGVLDVYRKRCTSTQSTSSTESSSSSSSGGDGSSLVALSSDAAVVPRARGLVLAPTLPGAVEQWFRAASDLAKSDDVRNLVRCSAHVLWTASSLSIHVALLPVTLPIDVTRHTTQLVVGSCVHVLQSTGTLLVHMIMPTNQEQHHPRRLVDAATSEQEQLKNQRQVNASLSEPNDQTGCSSGEETQPSDGNLISHVLGVPWMLLCVAGKVKDDVGALVFPPQTPPHHQQQQQPEPPSALRKGKVLHVDNDSYDEPDNFLDRLRLDYHSKFDTPMVDSHHPTNGTNGKHATSAATLADDDDECYPKKQPPVPATAQPQRSHVQSVAGASYSKFLLPALDLGLDHEGRTVHYVDLQSSPIGDASSSSSSVVAKALDRMVEVGLGLLANHPTVRLSSQSHNPLPKHGIDWRPEGNTPKLLRKMVPLSTLDRLKVLEQEVLIWSGSLVSSNKYPFFLARGVVSKRPCDFTKLLWDNQRTAEYNNFCLGRTTLLVLEDQVLSAKGDDALSGTKVVQSETRVPFTSLSVLVSCCMHVRPLEGADEGGFVIVSRSLYTGSAGTHWSPDGVEPTAKNEILWGINILRRVPNHPHLTDLTSLSQVGSTLVPRFLATRIGLMGIEDFFKNVRKAPAAKQPPPHRSASC